MVKHVKDIAIGEQKNSLSVAFSLPFVIVKDTIVLYGMKITFKLLSILWWCIAVNFLSKLNSISTFKPGCEGWDHSSYALKLQPRLLVYLSPKQMNSSSSIHYHTKFIHNKLIYQQDDAVLECNTVVCCQTLIPPALSREFIYIQQCSSNGSFIPGSINEIYNLLDSSTILELSTYREFIHILQIHHHVRLRMFQLTTVHPCQYIFDVDTFI